MFQPRLADYKGARILNLKLQIPRTKFQVPRNLTLGISELAEPDPALLEFGSWDFGFAERGKEPMKRFAFAFGLIGASVAGCTSFDSRVAVRDGGFSEYTQVVSESESPPHPALATRWQKMMVRIRENCRPDTAGGGCACG